MNKYFIGIDPGLSGGIGVINQDAEPIEVIDMPVLIQDKKNKEVDYGAVVQFLKKYPDAKVCIEDVKFIDTRAITNKKGHLSPKGLFTYGGVVKCLYGIVAGLERYCIKVLPQIWKKDFSLINTDKDASVARAKQLFPKIADKLLKSKDGRAEALLIAEYCRRKVA